MSLIALIVLQTGCYPRLDAYIECLDHEMHVYSGVVGRANLEKPHNILSIINTYLLAFLQQPNLSLFNSQQFRIDDGREQDP